jgi:hypothetical protein
VDPVGVADASAEVNVADPPSRPSLDVAIETLGHLRPRIEKLCERIAGWDRRNMDGAELRAAFGATVAKWEAATEELTVALELLNNRGFVAKTTAKSRKLAQLRKPGTKVVLDAPMAHAFSMLYSAEEIEGLEVVKLVGPLVLLKTGAREVGLVDVIKVEVKP